MSSGREITAAFKKAATWGTAVACGAGDGLLINRESIRRRVDHLPDDSAGIDFVHTADTGAVSVEGSLDAYLRYDGLDVMLALCLGQAGTPANPSTGVYTNSYLPTADVEGKFGALALHKGQSVHETPSAKVAGFTISGEAGRPVSVSFDLIGDRLNVNTTTGTNTNTTIQSVTITETRNRVLFRQAAFWLNDQDGDALSSNDAVYPSSFSLSFKRSLSGQYTADGDDYIDDPTEDGFAEISLSLEFPEYTSDTFLTDLGADTHKKMKLAFAGATIADTYARQFDVLFPHLKITNAEAAVSGPGKIAHPVEFAVLAATSAPTGMTGLTAPFRIDVQNTRATDPLA